MDANLFCAQVDGINQVWVEQSPENHAGEQRWCLQKGDGQPEGSQFSQGSDVGYELVPSGLQEAS
jgi:hypothetical protein